MLRRADLHESNHQLESRVREIRLPGSEGGAILISRPYPYPRYGEDARPPAPDARLRDPFRACAGAPPHRFLQHAS